MTETAAISLDKRSGRLLLDLAAFLADPVARIAPDRLARLCPDADRAVAGALYGHALWKPAVSALVRRAAGLEGQGPGPDLVGGLRVSDRDQILVRLALAPDDQLAGPLATLAACIYRRSIAGAIMGARVKQMRAVFGGTAHEVGLRQAGLLFPDLADFADPGMQFPEPDPETGALPPGTPFHIRDAQIVLGRMMAARHALIGKVFDVRFGWSSERKSPPAPARTAELSGAHEAQIMKLLRMKDAQWQMFSN